MLVIFQYVNYQYLSLFKEDQSADPLSPSTTDQSFFGRIDSHLKANINWDFLAVFFAVGLLLQLFLKILFNLFSDLRVPYDKWTIMDLLIGVLNLSAIYIVKGVTPADLEDPFIKDCLDYFMIVVLATTWIRFFIYFLVVRSISKLLLTLVEMIGDTMSFLIIVCCFLIIMASVFTTLFQDTDPSRYGSIFLTVRTLFDATLAVYLYTDKTREVSQSLLLIVHVFFANILLLNYLIAILSTTYENMK